MTSHLYLPLLLQLLCVSFIAWRLHGHVPTHLNWLLSSAFVTTPVWDYAPLSDVGMVFLFDLVVPLVIVRALYRRSFRIQRSVSAIVALVFILPLLYAPLGYLFVQPEYVSFHSVLLTTLLYRSFLIVAAAVLLAYAAKSEKRSAIVRLLAFQFLGLFTLGFLQYAAGLDLVVYERIKDVENAVDLLLQEDSKIFLGFGFLGLFRGAVPQMAIVALFWWMLLRAHEPTHRYVRVLFVLLLGLLLVCVVGSLSRIGIVAIDVAILYAALVSRGVLMSMALYIGAGLAFTLSQPDLSTALGEGLALMLDRFDFDQFSGETGSGVTRLDSARALLEAIATQVMPWVSGLGGFNPIATAARYEVFGMHGDYLDVIARYGVIVGTGYLLVVLLLFARQLRGFFSDVLEERARARSFGALLLGVALLGVTQGTLLFSGSAGYLACAQTWLAVAFAMGSHRRPTQAAA